MLNAQRIRRDVITIGGSAGGLEALLNLVKQLPRDLPAAVAVVLHRSPHFASELRQILARRTALSVLEPLERTPLRAGHVYIAPRDHHMLLGGDYVDVNRAPKQHWMRPAIDPLFVSAAKTFGRRVAGVILSGGGADGVQGLVAIKAAGGLSLVQDPGNARFPLMPMRAIRDDDVDAVLDIERLAAAVHTLARGEAFEVVAAPTYQASEGGSG
jgi:two-component system, chemotaxis family, protein-glutamate methylesterase/glutaminase